MSDSPGLFKYAVVKIDDVEYAQFVTTALVTGDTNIQTLRTAVPDGQITDSDSPVYTFQLAGAQGTALHAALVAAEGTAVEVEFQAEHGTGKSVRTFDWIVPVVPFGGTTTQFRTFDLTAAVSGGVVNSVSS